MFVESSDIIISTISHSGQYVVIAKHSVKRVHIQSYFGRHFHAFGLSTERYGVSLHIQSEYRKMRTRITLNTDTSRSEICECFQNDLPGGVALDTGRKWNVRKTFRRRPGHLLDVSCTCNLRPQEVCNKGVL